MRNTRRETVGGKSGLSQIVGPGKKKSSCPGGVVVGVCGGGCGGLGGGGGGGCFVLTAGNVCGPVPDHPTKF